MCKMVVPENLVHIIIKCLYLDGARVYALLLWANKPVRTVYNLFNSAFKTWNDDKIIRLLLDPISEISDSSIRAHGNNLISDYINFAQDFLFSTDKQRHDFYSVTTSTKDDGIYCICSVSLYCVCMTLNGEQSLADMLTQGEKSQK